MLLRCTRQESQELLYNKHTCIHIQRAGKKALTVCGRSHIYAGTICRVSRKHLEPRMRPLGLANSGAIAKPNSWKWRSWRQLSAEPILVALKLLRARKSMDEVRAHGASRVANERWFSCGSVEINNTLNKNKLCPTYENTRPFSLSISPKMDKRRKVVQNPASRHQKPREGSRLAVREIGEHGKSGAQTLTRALAILKAF